MKIVSALIVTSGLLAASFASAKSPEQAYIESFQGRSGTPVPVAVVKPRVPEAYSGRTVFVEFTVDAAGVPRGVRSPDASLPPELVMPIIDAVAQWRFAPLTKQGEAVSARVLLPVAIVSELDTHSMVATR